MFIYDNNLYILFFICRAGGGRGWAGSAPPGPRGRSAAAAAAGTGQYRGSRAGCSPLCSAWARPPPSAAKGRAEPSVSEKGELGAVGTPPVGNGPARVPGVGWREGVVPSRETGVLWDGRAQTCAIRILPSKGINNHIYSYKIYPFFP